MEENVFCLRFEGDELFQISNAQLSSMIDLHDLVHMVRGCFISELLSPNFRLAALRMTALHLHLGHPPLYVIH